MTGNSQPGIFSPNRAARYFLEYRLRERVDAAAVRGALAAAGLAETSASSSSLVVAFGPDAAASLGLGVEVPPFEGIQGPQGNRAPATQRDLFFWIQGAGHDVVFDRVLRIHGALDPVADLELDVRGFDYHESRDLIGFEDGTANPKGDDAAAAALIPQGQPGAGGSYVLTQQWVHDLPAFAGLSVEQQEQVVGRTKAESIELEGEAMPADSHVSRTDVEIDGKAMKILRCSSPYGSALRHGLYFLAFACEIERFQVQLERMYGVSEDGLYDRITDFSRAVTGSYWFAPPAEVLAELTGS